MQKQEASSFQFHFGMTHTQDHDRNHQAQTQCEQFGQFFSAKGTVPMFLIYDTHGSWNKKELPDPIPCNCGTVLQACWDLGWLPGSQKVTALQVTHFE